jgi:hypothetical protein
MPKIQIRRGLYEDLKAIVLDIGEPCFIIDRGNNIVGNGVDNVETLLLNQPTLEDLNEKLNKSQITNCLLEVPQRIKLELNNGTLTLKAGSEVIVPNGFEADGTTPKFDYVTIESDVEIILSTAANVTCFCVYDGSTDTVRANASTSYSGDGSDTPNGWYYNTTTNKIYYIGGSGNVSRTDCSFPIAMINYDGNIAPQIKQIFNGFGYIGSTVWVDKGVKGLIPNGRNEDGSLKNIEYITQTINIVSAFSGTATRTVWINPTGTLSTGAILYEQETPPPINSSGVERWFNTTENVWYYHASGETAWRTTAEGCVFGYVTSTSGVITSFQPKQPFRAVDYNDKSEISGWAMPSSKYTDLTLGASGSTYIAPANGWVTISKRTNANNQMIELINSTCGYVGMRATEINGRLAIALLPVKKGDQFHVNYTAGGELAYLRFVYAEGEV